MGRWAGGAVGVWRTSHKQNYEHPKVGHIVGSPSPPGPEDAMTSPTPIASPASATAPVATAAPDATVPAPSPQSRRRLGAALIGSAVEVFDWTIYSTFAAFFAASFFGQGGDRTAYLETLVVFAVGFIARPLGSLVFGRISDVHGRRASLIATSATALIGTLLIAVAPTAQTIGLGAAILLVVARIVQGLAHGGEQPAAGAYISEIASPGRRGAWSSLIYVSIMLGGVAGTLLGAILSSTLGPDALTAWAWRIPFLVAGVASVIAVVLVSRLEETSVFEATAAGPRPSLLREMLRSWRPALQIIGLTLGITIAFQNWAAMAGYHIAIFDADPTAVMWASVAANVLAMITLPLWGRLSDRIGRRPVVLIGFIGVAVTTWPLMRLLDGSWQHMLLAMGVSLVLLAAPLSILPALMAELVPTSVRTIGVGFSYALATAIFGGTVPALQAWIAGTWGPQNFGVYVTLAMLVSLGVALTIPETRAKDLTDHPTTEELPA